MILKNVTQCLMLDNHTDGPVFVSPLGANASSDYETLEQILQFASMPCMQMAIPFACQYFFPVCNGSGFKFPPSKKQCLEVESECSTDLSRLGDVGLSITLPDCNILPETESSCAGQYC